MSGRILPRTADEGIDQHSDVVQTAPILGGDSADTPGEAARAVGRCAAHTTALLLRRRLRQPRGRVGRVISFEDGTSAAVYRETVVERGPATRPTTLVVSFKLRLVRAERAHALFRAESVLNTILFAGFPGLVSKLWLRHDQNGAYRGVYQWDGADLALRYVNALWWVLALVSVPGSIRYAVVPGADRDEMLAHPDRLGASPGGTDGWWRPALSPAPGDPSTAR
ncbi:MAG TPA: hypothetical protein VFH70_00670 [Acidimicrobiales bacterium]|nr:hypothetical protein [Acidimicrobiales bacterium]